MEICSVRSRIAEGGGRNTGTTWRLLPAQKPRWRHFFQNYQFDMRGNSIPIQDKHRAHQWIQQCVWVSEMGLIPWFTLEPKNEAIVADGGNYRRGSRKVRAWVTKGGWLREAHPELLNSNWGHKMLSRRYLEVWGRVKEIGIWKFAFRGWQSSEGIWGPFVRGK